jgi:peptidoglycan/xylan/chitin deacetylase (PgdA/CDA1 family)
MKEVSRTLFQLTADGAGTMALIALLLIISAPGCGPRTTRGTGPGKGQDSFSDSGDRGQTPLQVTELFSDEWIPRFSFTFDNPDWRALLESKVECPVVCGDIRQHVPATVTFHNPETGQDEVYLDVGVHYRGNSSVCEGVNPRFGFKVSFDVFVSGRTFHGMKQLNFLGTEGDNSLMREVLANRLMSAFGVPAAEGDYAIITINGEAPRIYPLIQESDDSVFLQHRFPGDTDGHLYKVEGICGEGTLEYLGPEADFYTQVYHPRAGTVAADMQEDLIPFLGCFGITSDSDFMECFEIHADTDRFLRAIAADLAMPDFDGLPNAAHNFSFYFTGPDRKGVVIPWDKDAVFRLGYCPEDSPLDCIPPWSNRPTGISRLMNVYEQDIEALVDEFMLGPMGPDILNAWIEELVDRLEPHILVDPDIMVGKDGWSWYDAVQVLRNEVALRREAISPPTMSCPPGEWILNDSDLCILCNEEGNGYTGQGLDVDDDDSCTTDTCDPESGVTHEPSEGSCWLPDPCQTNGTCVDGSCVGVPNNCNDGSPCTTDSCDPESGCIHEEQDGSCDDGNPMTPDDTCINGICVGILDADQDDVPNHGTGEKCNGPDSPAGCLDNCPFVANPDQLDSDEDGQGDACNQLVTWYGIETDSKVIALTFDDGWSNTKLRLILDALEAENAYATFFLNGMYIEDWTLQPETITRLLHSGHLLGNHTQDHTLGDSKDEAISQVLAAEELFFERTGATMKPLFRSPYYSTEEWLEEALLETGYSQLVYSSLKTDELDDQAPTPEQIAGCVADFAESGNIILMHVGPEVTTQALPLLLAEMKSQGYHFLNLEQMLYYGSPIDNPELSRRCSELAY